MKTTIDISEALLERAREHARRESRPLREIVEEALQQRLDAAPTQEPFRLRRHTFRGRGLQQGVPEGDWDRIRELIYGM